jgi:hypothetical protein
MSEKITVWGQPDHLVALLRQYYERLRAAGKPGKVAVIAAMRKLAVAVWSVAKYRRPFVPMLAPSVE